MIERVAIGDVAYPRNQSENQAMAGFALLLVTSVVHDQSELPLSRVIAKTKAGELALQRAALKRSELTGGKLLKTLGAYRTDELYYLPLLVTRVPGLIAVDFAAHRSGLEIMSFLPEDDAMPAGVTVPNDIAQPDVNIALKIADEEFEWSR